MNQQASIGVIALLLVTAIIGIQLNFASLMPNFDWSESIVKESDEPYGTSALFELVKSGSDSFQVVNRPAKDFLSDSIHGTYFFTSNELFIGNESRDTLLKWVAKGNTAFLATKHIPYFIDSVTGYDLDSAMQVFYHDTGQFTLDQKLDADSTVFTHLHRVYNDTTERPWSYLNDSSYYWDVEDVYPIHSLGRFYYGHNFFEITHGNGRILLHTEPILFSNYFIFKAQGFKYANLSLSTIDKEFVYWDDYHHTYHQERRISNQTVSDGALKVLYENSALRATWILLMVGIMLYIAFRSKRQQRVIPIISYAQNTSRAYANALGTLYHRTGRPKYLASEMMTMFHNHNRRKYHIEYNHEDPNYVTLLAKKAKVKESLIKDILGLERKLLYNDMAKMRDIGAFYELLNIYYKTSR